ncbi:MAG TPA: CbiX/SirB N-terminal domain-containing protein [Tepidisphaeraceae bacterium]|jgi:sirohydrochlorin ferrochelatase
MNPIASTDPRADTAIVIVDHGSRRMESNRMLEEVARLFGERFKQHYAIVEPAHMELCEPSIATAYASAVRRGARRVIVAPFFLSFGKHWTRDIPSLLSQAAADFPDTEYQLVEPLGTDDLILDLLQKRVTTTGEQFFSSGEPDPRIDGLEPTTRREQCTSCPFKIEPDGSITDTRKRAG